MPSKSYESCLGAKTAFPVEIIDAKETMEGETSLRTRTFGVAAGLGDAISAKNDMNEEYTQIVNAHK
jgi:hypothetical protein